MDIEEFFLGKSPLIKYIMGSFHHCETIIGMLKKINAGGVKGVILSDEISLLYGNIHDVPVINLSNITESYTQVCVLICDEHNENRQYSKLLLSLGYDKVISEHFPLLVSRLRKHIQEEWRSRLNTPTQLNKCGKKYFIVDCCHHRIIYKENLEGSIDTYWTLMEHNYIGGHTVGYDGELLVCDNTDLDALEVFIETESGFQHIQHINVREYMPETIRFFSSNIKLLRPHFVLYNQSVDLFFVALSFAGSILILKNSGSYLEVVNVCVLPELTGRYVKSMSLSDNKLYCSAGMQIAVLQYSNGELACSDRYEIPYWKNSETGIHINHCYKFGSNFYITFMGHHFIRCYDLSLLKKHMFDDMYDNLGFKGFPYFISSVDDSIYLTEIGGRSAIHKLLLDRNGTVCGMNTLYLFDGITCDSRNRQKLSIIHTPV